MYYQYFEELDKAEAEKTTEQAPAFIPEPAPTPQNRQLPKRIFGMSIAQVSILGSSFDHTILQVPPEKYRLGDILSFRMRYPAVVRAMTSEYILKEYRGQEYGSEICPPRFYQALRER